MTVESPTGLKKGGEYSAGGRNFRVTGLPQPVTGQEGKHRYEVVFGNDRFQAPGIVEVTKGGYAYERSDYKDPARHGGQTGISRGLGSVEE